MKFVLLWGAFLSLNVSAYQWPAVSSWVANTPKELHPFYAGLIKIDHLGALTLSNPKNTLQALINLPHYRLENESDILLSDCFDLNENDCVKVKSLSYQNKKPSQYKSGARNVLFGEIHLEGNEGNYSVKDYYCLHDYTKEDYNESYFPKELSTIVGPTFAPFHEAFNAEHTWPKNRFEFIGDRNSEESIENLENFVKGDTKSNSYREKESDMHILLPTNQKLNEMRQNYEFGDVAEIGGNYDKYGKCQNNYSSKKCELEKSCHPKVKLGYTDIEGDLDNNSNKLLRFEPPIESKGDVARILFYFSTRYDVPMRSIEEAFLRKWHKEDPVDAMEIKRNNEIYKYQNVRNPFIDMPDLVDLIDNF